MAVIRRFRPGLYRALHYLLTAGEGHEFQLHVDSSTHKDAVQPGDEVHANITEDGHAEFLQRLERY